MLIRCSLNVHNYQSDISHHHMVSYQHRDQHTCHFPDTISFWRREPSCRTEQDIRSNLSILTTGGRMVLVSIVLVGVLTTIWDRLDHHTSVSVLLLPLNTWSNMATILTNHASGNHTVIDYKISSSRYSPHMRHLADIFSQMSVGHRRMIGNTVAMVPMVATSLDTRLVRNHQFPASFLCILHLRSVHVDKIAFVSATVTSHYMSSRPTNSTNSTTHTPHSCCSSV